MRLTILFLFALTLSACGGTRACVESYCKDRCADSELADCRANCVTFYVSRPGLHGNIGCGQ